MCKFKHLHAAVFALVFGTFAFFSCSGDNPAGALHNNQTEEYGSAVVTLPNLSAASLKKSAALLDTNSLTLLITAAGMDTMKYSWQVRDLRGQQVLIDGIPSGDNRYFSGFLTNKSGSVTHSGKVSVRIVTGTTVPVHLKLSGTGSADVCIEIEGYPSSCSSEQDTFNIYNCLSVSSPDNYSKGSLIATIYGNFQITGSISVSNNYDSVFYEFVKTISIYDSLISDSLKCKSCKAIVLNRSSGSLQLVNFTFDIRTQRILFGYISYKEDETADIASKFEAVDCYENPSDTIFVKNCLSTSSLNGGIGTGEFSFEYYPNIYGYVNGFVSVSNSSDTQMYSFYKVISISTDTGLYFVKSYIENKNSGSMQSIDFTVDRNTNLIKNGYIHENDSINSPVIVKLNGIDCQGNDTIIVHYPLLITDAYSDTGITTGTLGLAIVNNSEVSGELNINGYFPGVDFRSMELYGNFIQGDTTSDIILYGTDVNGCKHRVSLCVDNKHYYTSGSKSAVCGGNISRLGGGMCSEGILAILRSPAIN